MNATYIVTVYVVIDDVLKAIGHVDDSRTVISSARDLIQLALEVQVTLVVSPTVLEEAERNLSKNAPGKVEFFAALIAVVPFELVTDPGKEEILEAASYTE
ncbi:MAG: hypothetical protein GX577_16455, partial [Leptolinea sp.]|nr:hypothetical protein [Leptolinea sp.]